LSAAAAHYAQELADFVTGTGNAAWIASTDALRVLTVRGYVDVARRAWEAQWEPYERDLVATCRRAGISDAEIAHRLGRPAPELPPPPRPAV
jgi:hypothetical protein